MTDTVIILLGLVLGFNLVIYQQIRRLFKMVDLIGNIQHMQIFHPEELHADPCHDNGLPQYLRGFEDEIRQGNSHEIRVWDEGE